jgi:1-deoxy-D-xylulose-5-phosphate reductoisomerase
LKRKSISLLGSTGSIGRQTLEVAGALNIPVCALTANTSTGLLEEQARKFHPDFVAVFDERAARDMRTRLRDTRVRVVSGMDGLIEAATAEQAETVVTAVVGTVGLKPTLAAAKSGKQIALANKETLVCAGSLVMNTAREYKAEILPVDSEHSAIFQCLNGHIGKTYKRILLTASGGPFLGMKSEDLKHVSLSAALSNPNWNMGRKITVDSATLMNKGLEFIEAMHLYSARPEQIKVLVHPQSIIHSAVEFEDNTVIAQLSVPDMRLPIQYALTYPERCPSLTGELDLAKLHILSFEEPNTSVFRCLDLAMKTAAVPGTACAVMNAANEAAVSLFLEEKISFTDIYEFVSAALENIQNIADPSLEDILAADNEARSFVKNRLAG